MTWPYKNLLSAGINHTRSQKTPLPNCSGQPWSNNARNIMHALKTWEKLIVVFWLLQTNSQTSSSGY